MPTKPRSTKCPTVHTTLQAIHRTNGTLKTRADQDALLRKLLHNHDPALDEAQVTAELATYRRQLSHMLGRHGERDVRDKNYSIKAKAIHNLFVVGPVGMLDQSFLDTMDAFTDSGDDEDAEGEDEDADGSEAMPGPPSKPFKSTPIKLKLHKARASSATAAPTRSRTGAGLGEDFDFQASEEDDNRAESEPATPQSEPRPRSKLPARKGASRDIKPLSKTSNSHKRKASTLITIDDSEDVARPKSKQRLMAPVSNAAAEWAVPAGYTSARAQEAIPGSSRLRAPINYEETEDDLLPSLPPRPNIPKAHFGEMAGGKSKRRDRSSSEYQDDDETEPTAKRQKTMPHSTAPAKMTAPVTSEAVTKSKRRDRTTSEHDDNDETEPMAKRQKTVSTLTAHAKETNSVVSGTSTPDVLSAQHPLFEPAAAKSDKRPGRQMSDSSPLSDPMSQISVPETTAAPSGGSMAPPSLDAAAQIIGMPSEAPTAPPSLDASTQTTAPTPRADQETTTRKPTPEPYRWVPYNGPVDRNDPVDGKWVSRNMESAGDELFTSVLAYCQLNNIDPEARSTFVPKPSPELAALYEKMFGVEDWRMKVSDLEVNNQDSECQQVYTLMGLLGTGIRSLVFESGLPWDFQEKLETFLGAELDVLKGVLAKFYRHNYDGFVRKIKEAQILKPEFQEDQVAAHASQLANQLTEILRPHFLLLQKGNPPEDPLDVQHWGYYLKEAFSKAIIVKQMISASPFGPFTLGDAVFGTPVDRVNQKPRYEFSQGKAQNVFYGVLPGIVRNTPDGRMVTWSKTLLIPYKARSAGHTERSEASV
ncbi:unnamed protein product [Zymoseptoria tritici ST99CH_1A5]|uniref:Uncharacterized protein n=1 Tax=Zymoseptoria tritici ST99CH_1A5 TaxID=1276529 RepID=A0A1Y6LAZ5_ZYMTR|nr:unnamed protein product [Zymoseptoria tritici ST99CH_1A5]